MRPGELGPDESPDPVARPERRTTRIGYDAVVATFVAVLSVAVSAFTNLDDCWTMTVLPHGESSVVETARCPPHSATSFRQ